MSNISDCESLDAEELKKKLSEARRLKKLAEHREKVANKRMMKVSKQRDDLRVENAQYKTAVDSLSAENGKHKREIKRLKNKAGV